MTRFSHSFFFLPPSKCRAWLFWLQLLEKWLKRLKCIVSWLITTYKQRRILVGRDEYFFHEIAMFTHFFSFADKREKKWLSLWTLWSLWLLCKTVISSSSEYSNIFFHPTYITPHTTIANCDSACILLKFVFSMFNRWNSFSLW